MAESENTPITDLFELYHATHVATETQRLIELSDSKAHFFLTVSSAALAYLAHENYQQIWLRGGYSSVLGIASFVAFLALGIAIVCCAVSVVPSFRPTRATSSPMSASSMSAEEFAIKIGRTSRSEAVQDLAIHSHGIALLAKRKLRMLWYASIAMMLGMALTVVLVIFLRPPDIASVSQSVRQ